MRPWSPKLPTGLPETELTRQRQPHRYRVQCGQLEHGLVLYRREELPDGPQRRQVGIEEGPTEHADGESGQLRHHIDRPRADAVAEAGDEPLGLVRHDVRLGRDAPALERRRDHLALFAPELTLAGQEAVAQRPAIRCLRFAPGPLADECRCQPILNRAGIGVIARHVLRLAIGGDGLAIAADAGEQIPQKHPQFGVIRIGHQRRAGEAHGLLQP